MNPKAEDFLKKVILPELEKGRPNFDRPHTVAVVRQAKEILQQNPHLDIDPDILIPAAYAHDWGYSNLFDNGKIADYEDIKKVKPLHMEIGAKKIKQLLDENIFDYLSDSQKNRIVHLVRIHDKLDELKDIDELILMEADTLGAIDPDSVQPTFSKKGDEDYRKVVLKKRIANFITQYSKEQAKLYLEKRRAFYANKK